MAVLTLIENGELYDPVPRGKQSLLLANDRVEKVGHVDRRALDALEIRDVIARGKRMVVDGRPALCETFLAESSRNIDLVGAKYDKP